MCLVLSSGRSLNQARRAQQGQEQVRRSPAPRGLSHPPPCLLRVGMSLCTSAAGLAEPSLRQDPRSPPRSRVLTRRAKKKGRLCCLCVPSSVPDSAPGRSSCRVHDGCEGSGTDPRVTHVGLVAFSPVAGRRSLLLGSSRRGAEWVQPWPEPPSGALCRPVLLSLQHKQVD